MTNDFAILIADDNEINLWLLREQLEHWAMDITLAQDGREAWQLLQQYSYALVFLDVNMPFLNGFEVVEKLRTTDGLNRQTPVIAVTAHAQSQQRQQAVDAGFNEYLVKPIRLNQLQQIVTRWRQGDDNNANYYAVQILRKTQDNSQLSQTLLSKLFAELPTHMLDIERSLQNMAIQQAWELVHKLHGTFCFYDFADCLGVVESLEQALLHNEEAQANQQFSLLKVKLDWLLDNQGVILRNVMSNEGGSD
ncbi:response regulator [Methylomonas montana]|uniref:Hpt domain-containing response regulator n=1 Tax=Methylomonas montana TaxID=3058963 RepID=UPI002659422E|nr:response regulator [Methylomonas montana]WKJ89845.1 response regulator [Methylomonas montana]